MQTRSPGASLRFVCISEERPPETLSTSPSLSPAPTNEKRREEGEVESIKSKPHSVTPCSRRCRRKQVERSHNYAI